MLQDSEDLESSPLQKIFLNTPWLLCSAKWATPVKPLPGNIVEFYFIFGFTKFLKRFSGVFTERGDPDTMRDLRGWATKFYTTEGNWDLLAVNTPAFNARDMKVCHTLQN